MFSGISGEESGRSLGSVTTEDRGTGAEATSHSLGDRTQAPSEKDSYAELPPSPLPASSLTRPVPDSARGQGGRAYCWEIMASAQSTKATVMSCRRSQTQRTASLSCVFTQFQVTSPLRGKQNMCGSGEAGLCRITGLHLCPRVAKGCARGRAGQGERWSREPDPWGDGVGSG